MSDVTTVDPVTRKPRPLSPHLSIYRPIPTMVMSILHRITGAALYFGTILVAWFLVAAASGADAYETATGWLGSPLGLVVIFGYTWVLIHHMLGGLKHLLWDTGTGMQRPFITALAYAQIIASAVLTVLVWLMAITVS